MTLEKFVEFAKKQDDRNLFTEVEEVDFLKEQEPLFRKFYTFYNPEDVEVNLGENGVLKFFSLKELVAIQREYKCGDYLVFSTIEGDPIAIKEGKIYFGVHGTSNYNFEKIADSFRVYIESLYR